MTYDEAIAIRARDVSGTQNLPRIVTAEAVWTIREGPKGKRRFSAPRWHIDQDQVRLLEMEVGRAP